MNNTQKINFTQKFIIEKIKPKKKKNILMKTVIIIKKVAKKNLSSAMNIIEKQYRNSLR